MNAHVSAVTADLLADLPAERPADRPAERHPAYDARALVRGGVCAHILLDGQVYTLRITRAGKLILTK